MPGYEKSNPFSVCFNMLKMRYAEYDESISRKQFLHEHDKINVFINIESVFKYLSMIPDLEKKLILQRDFETILISDMLNLAGHYKRFFVNNGFDTRIYLYHTDLNSSEFSEFKYNEDYRTYYLVKYNNNPKFVYLTDSLKTNILPKVKTCCEFIPRVYYINATNIEGSLIPYTIAMEDSSRKNLLINSDFYETQYSFIPGFINHYFHRGPGYCRICSSLEEYIEIILKKDKKECQSLISLLNTYPLYCTLLSILGDKTRTIDGSQGIGPKTLEKMILESIDKKEITKDNINPNSISNIFGSSTEDKEEFVNNFYCTSVINGYQDLTESEKLSIFNQRKDRYDITSMQQLNATTFYNHPLILESLML